jgi:hypothetical protein
VRGLKSDRDGPGFATFYIEHLNNAVPSPTWRLPGRFLDGWGFIACYWSHELRQSALCSGLEIGNMFPVQRFFYVIAGLIECSGESGGKRLRRAALALARYCAENKSLLHRLRKLPHPSRAEASDRITAWVEPRSRSPAVTIKSHDKLTQR